MKQNILMLVGSFVIAIGTTVASASPRLPDLVKACAKECPGAETDADVLNCAEPKEHDAAFKASKCGQEHSRYEKMAGGHHDHSSKKQ